MLIYEGAVLENKLNIIYKKLTEIMPYERNPRNNDEAVDKVAESIKEFGFKVPIVVDAAGVIVAGHTRYKAAKTLGIEEVPCIIADDLNPYQISAFRLADNKVAEFSGWDFSMLEVELSEIDGFVDMKNFGFEGNGEMPDIDSLFDDAPPEKQNEEPKTIVCPHCGEIIEL